MHGSSDFLKAARLLIFGERLNRQVQASVASIQTISGAGANGLIARFLGEHLCPANVWLPDPTWENHFRIWRLNAPKVTQRLYPHFNDTTRSFDLEGMRQRISKDAQPNDVIILHACAHNPTGLDPSRAQWKEIAKICEEKRLFVVFDCAYQGFASGNLDDDAWAVRYFLSRPSIELAVCQSFSKNMGLYGERVGGLHVVVSRSSPVSSAQAVFCQLFELQLGTISMPPLFGARIATQVMTDPVHLLLWKRDLAEMSGRIKAMRKALYDGLRTRGVPGEWRHVIEQRGMFCYTGLTKQHVVRLQKKFHIYMLETGRVSICGLSSSNVDYVVNAICEVIMEEMELSGQLRSSRGTETGESSSAN